MSLIVLSGCASAPNPQSIQSHLSERFQNDYLAPYVAGNIDVWLEVFAEDAVALHDGMPALQGSNGIRGFGDAVSSNFVIRKMDARIDEVRLQARWAWTRGTFVANFEAKSSAAPPGVAGERAGKFLLIWELGDDDLWRVVMDMGNSLPMTTVP